MAAREDFSFKNLTSIYQRTPERPLRRRERIVIFSDLHIGDGTRTDDFRRNSELFSRVLRDYYLDGEYQLVLNGDIEELQRFRLADIVKRWKSVYSLFDEFEHQGRLHRLVGNHDLDLMQRTDHSFAVRDALRLSYHKKPIFIFHGHQTSMRFEKYNKLFGFGLRYFARPLNIKNYSVSHDSVKRFRTEERVYEFASAHKVLSIIGHTHRPLFESMSKVDSIKFEIERLCRKYPKASTKKQIKIERSIAGFRSEIEHIDKLEDPTATVASLYNANLVVPCMFNSGTVIGKRGMTCIEIADGGISLVHWFDDTRSDKYLRYANYDTQQLAGTDYHRVEIESDSLDYIFARIKLLAGSPAELFRSA